MEIDEDQLRYEHYRAEQKKFDNETKFNFIIIGSLMGVFIFSYFAPILRTFALIFSVSCTIYFAYMSIRSYIRLQKHRKEYNKKYGDKQ